MIAGVSVQFEREDNVLLTDLENLDNIEEGYLGSTPSPGKLPQRGERLWIDRPTQLIHAVNLLKQAAVVAVDAEFTQPRVRVHNDPAANVPRLALLQLAIDDHCFVVDALRLQSLIPLNEVVDNPDIAILLHGAGADLRVMAARELHVAHYFDLEATSRSLFGQRESSLAAMLQRAFNYHLDKTLQRTDWTRRPLPQAMISYAARDAEVTLALYGWLERHYHQVLSLHETTGTTDLVAPWIEPFLRGNATASPEMAISEARAKGQLRGRAQVVTDCRTALLTVKQPMHQNRLLRLISDLSLTQLSADIQPLLQSSTADARCASARALGRMGVKSALEPISLLLQDPVYDVRKAAQTALRHLLTKDSQNNRPVATRNVDGARRWVIENATQPPTDDGNDDWKSRLRSIMDA
jgi:Ribonuclease D